MSGGLGQETGPSGVSGHSGLGQETGPSGVSGHSGLGQETDSSGVSGHSGLGQETGSSSGVFRVKPGFQFFYTLPLLLALAILIDVLFSPAPDKWLFLLLVLALAAISVPRGWSKVTLEGERLTVHTPLRRPRAIDLRRLTDLEISPRIGQAIVLRYHPDNPHGQPDLTSEAVLGLPPLQDQAILEEHLRNDYGISY